MILGVGVDLVSVSRIERILGNRWADKFLSRIFSPEEIGVCQQAPAPAQSYAARFAAKEAFAKALGTGFTRGVSPGTVLIRGGERNRPEIVLAEQALKLAQNMNVGAIHVSLSHIFDTACAVVVVETRD